MNVAVLAGVVSTVLFAMSYLPMLLKALRTRDLDSYSLGYLALSNAAKAVHSVYVVSLPTGPIWQALLLRRRLRAAAHLVPALPVGAHRSYPRNRTCITNEAPP